MGRLKSLLFLCFYSVYYTKHEEKKKAVYYTELKSIISSVYYTKKGAGAGVQNAQKYKIIFVEIANRFFIIFMLSYRHNKRKKENKMTVKELIEQLKEMPQNAKIEIEILAPSTNGQIGSLDAKAEEVFEGVENNVVIQGFKIN